MPVSGEVLRRTGGLLGPGGVRGARVTTCGGGAALRNTACVQRESRPAREGVRWALLGGVYRQKSVKMGKSVNPGPFGVSGCGALSSQRCACMGCAFLSFCYDYGLHDYGMQVLNAVLGMVVSFCDQTQGLIE